MINIVFKVTEEVIDAAKDNSRFAQEVVFNVFVESIKDVSNRYSSVPPPKGKGMHLQDRLNDVYKSYAVSDRNISPGIGSTKKGFEIIAALLEEFFSFGVSKYGYSKGNLDYFYLPINESIRLISLEQLQISDLFPGQTGFKKIGQAEEKPYRVPNVVKKAVVKKFNELLATAPRKQHPLGFTLYRYVPISRGPRYKNAGGGWLTYEGLLTYVFNTIHERYMFRNFTSTEADEEKLREYEALKAKFGLEVQQKGYDLARLRQQPSGDLEDMARDT